MSATCIVTSFLFLFLLVSPGRTTEKTETRQSQEDEQPVSSKNQPTARKWRGPGRGSVGLFSGYVLSHYPLVTDGPTLRLFGEPDPPSAYLHTFNAGVRADIELSSWFSFGTQLFLTQGGVVVEPMPFAAPRFSRYLHLDWTFQFIFFWRIKSFKIVLIFSIGPGFHLSRPELFGVLREPANPVQWAAQELLSLEYQITPEYSLFLTGGIGFTSGPYGESFGLGNAYLYFPVFFGVNRSFSF